MLIPNYLLICNLAEVSFICYCQQFRECICNIKIQYVFWLIFLHKSLVTFRGSSLWLSVRSRCSTYKRRRICSSPLPSSGGQVLCCLWICESLTIEYIILYRYSALFSYYTVFMYKCFKLLITVESWYYSLLVSYSDGGDGVAGARAHPLGERTARRTRAPAGCER